MSKAVGKSKSAPATPGGPAPGPAPASAPGDGSAVLRRHAEEQFAEELAALATVDDRPRPPRWRLSPWAVSTTPSKVVQFLAT